MQRIRILYHESQGANDPDIHIGYDMHRVSEPDRKETEYAEGVKSATVNYRDKGDQQKSKKVLGQKTLSRCLSAMLLASALLLSLCAWSKENSSGKTDGTQEMQSVETGENLIIPISRITETAKFYPVTVNGTQMEVIAVRDSNGKIRTAFNTCRICYDSGRGYYKQEGKALVCQNCGNRFTTDQIGGESGGCIPYPIPASNKTVTDDSILIPYDFLESSRIIFSNWKSSW